MTEIESQVRIITPRKERELFSFSDYRKRKFESIPVLTPEEEVATAKTFSTLEFSTLLLKDVLTNTQKGERLLAPPGKEQKNPILAKAVAETILEKSGLSNHVDLIYDTNENLKTKHLLSEQEKLDQTAIIGYEWKKGVNNRHKKQIVKQLEEQTEDAQKARETLITHNLRWGLVVANTFPNKSLPVDDRVQLSFLGIMRAAERFDWRSGHKFSYYSQFWINKEIQEAIYSQARIIRIPKDIEHAIVKFRQTAEALEKENEEKQPIKKIKDTVKQHNQNFSSYMIDTAADLYTKKKLKMLSLDVSDENGKTFESSLKSPTETEPDALVLVKHAHLHAAISQLSAREQQVIFMRYVEEKTFQQIGQVQGISREKVRQIEERVREKLKNNPLVKQIKDIVE